MEDIEKQGTQASFSTRTGRQRYRGFVSMAAIALLLSGVLVIECCHMDLFQSLLILALGGMLLNIFICTAYGFNAIYYSCQSKLYYFRIWHLLSILSFTGVVFYQELRLMGPDYRLNSVHTAVALAMAAIIFVNLILEFLLMVIITRKIRLQDNEDGKEKFKKAATDRFLYGNNLEKVLVFNPEAEPQLPI